MGLTRTDLAEILWVNRSPLSEWTEERADKMAEVILKAEGGILRTIEEVRMAQIRGTVLYDGMSDVMTYGTFGPGEETGWFLPGHEATFVAEDLTLPCTVLRLGVRK